MSKEINVSKCDFYDKDKKYCLTLKMNITGFKNPSCFSGDFQECIQDSKVCPNTFCDNNPNCYYKQLQRLKVANEELRKEMQYEINASQKWYQEHTNEKFKADKYKQCLDEIEEIVNKHYATILEFYKAIKKIQQKIKEVKGNVNI